MDKMYDPAADRESLARLCTLNGRFPPVATSIPDYPDTQVIRRESEIIGFAMIYHAENFPMSYLDWVVVDPSLEGDEYIHTLTTLVDSLTARAIANGAQNICASFQAERDCELATTHCAYQWGETAIDTLTVSNERPERPPDSEPTMDRFIGGAFVPGSAVAMADGADKPIEAVRVGDILDEGGLVTATVQINLTHTYDYRGLICAGENLVWSGRAWRRVYSMPDAIARDRSRGDQMIALMCESHRIHVGGHLFADMTENEELAQAMISTEAEDEALEAMNARV